MYNCPKQSSFMLGFMYVVFFSATLQRGFCAVKGVAYSKQTIFDKWPTMDYTKGHLAPLFLLSYRLMNLMSVNITFHYYHSLWIVVCLLKWYLQQVRRHYEFIMTEVKFTVEKKRRREKYNKYL